MPTCDGVGSAGHRGSARGRQKARLSPSCTTLYAGQQASTVSSTEAVALRSPFSWNYAIGCTQS